MYTLIIKKTLTVSVYRYTLTVELLNCASMHTARTSNSYGVHIHAYINEKIAKTQNGEKSARGIMRRLHQMRTGIYLFCINFLLDITRTLHCTGTC